MTAGTRSAAWSTVTARAIAALRAADAKVIEAALFWRANQLYGLGGSELRAACDARVVAELRALRAGRHLLWARLRLRKAVAAEADAASDIVLGAAHQAVEWYGRMLVEVGRPPCAHPNAKPATRVPGMTCPDCGAVFQRRGEARP